MAYSRRLGVVSILGACWFVTVGCSDEEDRKPNGSEDGGESGGGKAGTSAGGASSKAGSGGKGGTAGSAGSASAGDAGSGSGGEAGTGAGGDAGGDAGSGGIVAGAGGEGIAGGGAGEGGVSGSGGAGGEGGAPAAQLLSCAYECEGTEDCGSLTCDEVTHRCVPDPATSCQVKDDCAPFSNFAYFWSPCSTTADCFNDGTDACINWQGKGAGYCALLTLDGCLSGVATTVAELGANGNVSVCVEQGVCLAGACELACNHDFAEPCLDSGRGDACNPTTGRCECAAPAECDSNLCGVDLLCQQCGNDSDCAGAQFGLDKCVDGRCGCSSVDVCPTTGLPNATPHCE